MSHKDDELYKVARQFEGGGYPVIAFGILLGAVLIYFAF
jgi:hypothetical protein